MKVRYLLPVVIFIVLIVVFAIGLNLDKEEIPSPFINQSAPEFSAETLIQPPTTFSNKDFIGKVTLFNIWASWCTACLAEHPLITNLSRRSDIQIIGLNYKDETDDAKSWLNKYGNPYDVIITDKNGDIGIDYGVYGVPETFIIDKSGIVRLKKVGELDQQIVNDRILPLLETLVNE